MFHIDFMIFCIYFFFGGGAFFEKGSLFWFVEIF